MSDLIDRGFRAVIARKDAEEDQALVRALGSRVNEVIRNPHLMRSEVVKNGPTTYFFKDVAILRLGAVVWTAHDVEGNLWPSYTRTVEYL